MNTLAPLPDSRVCKRSMVIEDVRSRESWVKVREDAILFLQLLASLKLFQNRKLDKKTLKGFTYKSLGTVLE